MNLSDVARAYGARAADYTNAVGRMEHAAAADRATIQDWAMGTTGELLDVGCGPGQWTNWLSERGYQICGIDPAEVFVRQAEAAYPGTRFAVGSAESLGAANESIGGILAWYSLIHSDEAQVEAALAEFARCIRPGGTLLIGFFAGTTYEQFDHAIAPAYFWPVASLAAKVASAGLDVLHTGTRTDPGARMHGEILAMRQHMLTG